MSSGFFISQLKITTFDGKPLPPTAVGSMVTVSVMQGTDSPWGWPKDTVGDIKPWDNLLGPRNMPPPTMGSPEVMEIALPSTGIVNLHILVKNDTQTLTIDVSKHRFVGRPDHWTRPEHSSRNCPRPAIV